MDFEDQIETAGPNILEKWSIGISGLVVTFLMLLTTVDVVLRYVFNSPIPGAYSLCEMLMIGVVYPAIAFVQGAKGHVRVDIIIDRLRGIRRTTFELATLWLALVAFSGMCWKSTMLAWENWVTGDYAMGLLNIPYWPTKTVMSLGLALLCLRFLQDIKACISKIRGQSQRWWLWVITSITPLILFWLMTLILSPGTLSATTIGWIMIAAMFVVLLMGLPIAFGLLFVAIAGYWILSGPLVTLSIMGIIPYDKIANYTLSVVPLFILMGHLAFQAGFATSMYKTCQVWLGRLPGSMAQATVVGGAAFGAACGAGVASAATLAKICVPIMREHNVDLKMSLGCVAAVGGLAALIPPSIMMVIYAMITNQSSDKLLIAGMVPGLLAAASFMIMIFFMVKRNPKLAPPLTNKVTWRDKILSLKESWGIAVLGIVVIGGIFTGIFTPTEAGALGASGTLLLGIVTRRLTFRNFIDAVNETTKTTAMIFLIIASAMVLANFMAISRLPSVTSDFVMGLDVPRSFILAGVIALYLVAGCIMDMTSFMLLTMPIVFPAITGLGYDPVWFGVIIVILCELALISPPFGLNLFILRAMNPEVGMGDIIRGSLPFTLMYFIVTILCCLFPIIVTWLPSIM